MAKETLRNTNTVEITGKDVTVKTTNGGTENEKITFSFSGRIKKNLPTIIGTMTLTSAENKYLSKNGTLLPNSSNLDFGLNSNLQLKPKSVTKDSNGNATGYVYNLLYTAKENVAQFNKLKYSVNNGSRKIIPKSTSIDDIIYGIPILSELGETRKITIKGSLSAQQSFKIAINRIEESLDAEYNAVGSGEEYSILPKTLSKIDPDSTLWVCRNYEFIEGYLDEKGEYSFDQFFPKTTNPNTKYSISYYQPTSVSAGYSASDVVINRLNKNVWKKTKQGWEDWYTVTLNQYVDPVLTIQLSTTNARYGVNGVQANMTTPFTFSKKFNSKYKSKVKGKIKHSLSYDLLGDDDGLTVASRAGSFPLGHIVFSNSGGNSSFTNSNSLTNGGTKVEIINIVRDDNITGDTANIKAKITFDLIIINGGTRSTTMTLNLDNHITCS